MRIAEQAAILDAAKAYVKPGGRLVYITCSVFAAENAGQIDAFLGREPGFRRTRSRRVVEPGLPGKADAVRIDGARGISLTPAKSGTDGFFFVRSFKDTVNRRRSGGEPSRGIARDPMDQFLSDLINPQNILAHQLYSNT